MKTRVTFWISLLLICLLLIIQTFLKDVAIERAIYFILLLMAAGWFITRESIKGFSLERKGRESRQQVGQYFRENYEIINDSSFPKLWVSIEDRSNLLVEHRKKIITWILPKSKNVYSEITLLSKRGVFTLGPTIVRSGDPFGFFSNSTSFTSKEKILVLPFYESISFFPDPAGILSGGNAKKTRNLEVSPYAISIREYAPGDPLRRIDWKSSARQNKLMVKEFEQDPQSNVWIFLDGDYRYHFQLNSELLKESNNDKILFKNKYFLPADTFEYCVSVAASIANYYLANDKSLGFCSNSQNIFSLSPEKGERQLSKVMEVLALVQADSTTSLEELLETQSSQIKKGSTLIVISSTDSPNIVFTLENMKKRGVIPIFVNINSQTFGNMDFRQELSLELNNTGIRTITIEKDQTLTQNISQAF